MTIIGAPKENETTESRVAITPQFVQDLKRPLHKEGFQFRIPGDWGMSYVFETLLGS